MTGEATATKVPGAVPSAPLIAAPATGMTIALVRRVAPASLGAHGGIVATARLRAG